MMTTTQFIASVKRAISIPTYQGRFNDDDFLAFANEEQLSMVQPLLTAMRENYNLTSSTTAVVASTAKYAIPARAMGRAIVQCEYLATANGNYYNLPQLKVEEAYMFGGTGQSGDPTGFYIEGDKIVLVPTPARAGTLKVRFNIQMAKLVKTNRTLTLSSLTNDTVTASETSVPSNIALTAGSNKIDITNHTPGYQAIITDVTVTNITSVTLTLSGYSATNTLASNGIEQFNIISTAGETSILQMPDELQPVLIHATAVRILEGLAVPDRLQMAKEQLQKFVSAANRLMEPRVEGALEKVFSKNGLIRNRWASSRYPISSL